MPEVIVSIYNHKYRLAVSTGEEDLLRDCAAQIDRQMEAMKASGKVIAADQIAVLTALEVAYEAKKAEEAAKKAAEEKAPEPPAPAKPQAEAQPVPLATEPAHTDEDLEHVRRLCRLCEDAIFRDTKIGALF
ncbi:MAG: cell division protein ZapA [Sutterella sp.]|jgi:cell division protein ZapA (FtsZ GTPase activity inhibitor)|nr:cell division protein ZapA [Sutterella sp.]